MNREQALNRIARLLVDDGWIDFAENDPREDYLIAEGIAMDVLRALSADGPVLLVDGEPRKVEPISMSGGWGTTSRPRRQWREVPRD